MNPSLLVSVLLGVLIALPFVLWVVMDIRNDIRWWKDHGG